jgi:6-phosphogluconolactonase/glucosamine-6-phosphate isomerase/deaminase
MEHELVTVADAASLATRAAGFVAGRARAAVADHGQFSFAVSGGTTPWAMFAQLTRHDLPWDAVRIYQVDERVAPDGDPDRNLTHLRQSLGRLSAVVHPRAEELLWLVSGADKHRALSRLLARDPSIPAGRVDAEHSTIFADAASVADQTGTSATGDAS